MATVNSAIMRASKLRPDCFDDETKLSWLCELDEKILTETMHKEKGADYVFPRDLGRTLSVPPPYDNIYELYIIAMGDFFSGELASYAASAAMFDTAYEEFKKSYIRHNMPPGGTLKL